MKAAGSLGTIQALGAVLEFLIGPLFGKLSDVFGRKAIMQLNPIVVFIYNMAILKFPRSLWAHYIRVPVIAIETQFYVAMHAMMADCMSGSNRAQNGFINMAPAGLAVMAAPLIAARLSTRNNFVLAMACSAVCVAVVNQLLETLPPKSRQPLSSLDLSSCNPFAFIQLFQRGRTLATLTLCSGVQTFTDPRLMDECAVVVMKDKGLDDASIQGMLSIMSVSLISGVGVGKFSVKRLGRLNHTHSSHFFKILAYVIWSQAATKTLLRVSQALLVFGQRQRDGVETLLSDVAVRKGIGKGLVEAYKFNFRSISNLLAPLLYAKLFALGKAVGFSGLPFVGAAIVTATAEMIICTLGHECLAKEVGGQAAI